MKKLLLILVTVALLATTAVGCNTKKTTSSGSTNNPNDTTLTIWENAEKEVLASAITDYETNHPGIKVVIESIPDGSPNLLSALQMNIGAGTAPDMVVSPSDYILSAGRKGYIVDLTKYGANDIKDQFTETCWNIANASPTGEIFGIPFDSNIINFCYNKDMFDKVGVAVPKTYDEMISVSDKIKSYYGGDGVNWAYSAPYDAATSSYVAWGTFHYYWYLWRCGGDIFSKDLTTCTINSEAAVTALQMLVDFKNKGYAAGTENMPAFVSGNVAMVENTTIGFYQCVSGSTANLALAMMPTLKEGVDPYTGMGLYCYGVTSSSTHPQEAFDFLSYFCTTLDYQVDYCKPYYFIPSLKAAADLSYYKTEEWKIIIEQAKYGKATPGVNNWQDMDKAIYDAEQAALSGEATAKDALDTAYEKIVALME